MRPARLVRAAAAIVALLLPGASASAQDVSGRWAVTWAQAVRNEADGTMTVQRWGDATLELAAEGERVTGTWTERVRGVVTWRVEGTFRDGRLALSATEHDSDDPELAAVARLRWRGTLADGRLEGEMTLAFRGSDRERPWRPWCAVRAGGQPSESCQ